MAGGGGRKWSRDGREFAQISYWEFSEKIPTMVSGATLPPYSPKRCLRWPQTTPKSAQGCPMFLEPPKSASQKLRGAAAWLPMASPGRPQGDPGASPGRPQGALRALQGVLRAEKSAKLQKSPLGQSIRGLVVEYIVAIDVTRVRFPADASVTQASGWAEEQQCSTNNKS